MPGTVPEGKVCDVPVTSPDFFPTLMDVVGVSFKSGKNNHLEGINLWPVITKGEIPEKRTIFWHYPHHRNNEKSMASAVR